MADTTYNGWTNYETWNVKLWIDNEEGDYRYWLERIQSTKDDNQSDCETCHATGLIDDEACDDCDGDGTTLDIDPARYSLMTELQEWVEENNPIGDQASMYTDLLGAALSDVNWREIADNMLDD